MSFKYLCSERIFVDEDNDTEGSLGREERELIEKY